MPFKVPTPLSQASEKRSTDGTSPLQPAKKPRSLPPLGDLVAMEAAPKKPNAQRLPAEPSSRKQSCALRLATINCVRCASRSPIDYEPLSFRVTGSAVEHLRLQGQAAFFALVCV